MPIPTFTIDGVLPPFVGPNGPGGTTEDMSPYLVSVAEVVATLALSKQRKTILRGWLQHRAALRAIGLYRGFQWLDGSFVENKDPRDVDVVTFLYRPSGINLTDFNKLLVDNVKLFDRAHVKATYHVDVFFVDLDGPRETLVKLTRYFFGLFSHRRSDHLWKGMLEVKLEDVANDAAALAALASNLAEAVAAEGENP